MLLPVLYNLSELLNLGNYSKTEDYNIDLGAGTGGINADFLLGLTYDDRYRGTITFNVHSTGSVGTIGITSIDYDIKANGQTKAHYDNNFNPPRLSFQNTHNNLNLDKDDVVTCEGSAMVRFLVGGIEQDTVIFFENDIIITISSFEIEYTWDIVEIWLQIFDYIAIFASVIFLARTIRIIKFEKEYTEDMRKDDEEFFEKIRKNIEKEKTL
ncbi:MAG: hypothetical protein ACFFBY_07285 [Promethearchaeota archaeon]